MSGVSQYSFPKPGLSSFSDVQEGPFCSSLPPMDRVLNPFKVSRFSSFDPVPFFILRETGDFMFSKPLDFRTVESLYRGAFFGGTRSKGVEGRERLRSHLLPYASLHP